ncbi:major facilitator superfamily domain-containing protein [Colletotrichum lupini]|nr:major facilitator superfamily domain-containing protein [Colletotrichum lupini]
MVDDGVVRVVRNPQTQQASRGEAVINDDCWDFENMGSHLQVTHIDGTVRNVDRDALGTTISSESGRIWLLMLAQSLAITAAFLGWVAPGNTSVLFHTDLPQTDKFMGSSIGFLLLGRLSDLYGRRHFIVGTSLLGVVGCLLGSFAVNAEMLIAANICNGMAAAAQLPLGVAVAELVPNKDRARTVAEAFSTAEQPLMPPKMFKNVQFASLVACATFSSMVFYALTVLWPFVIGKVFNKDSDTVAWSASLLPFGATLGIALTAVPSLRGERFRKQCMVASGVALALMAPLCTIWFDIRHGLIVLAGICASFALGHIVAVAITGVTLVWEPQDIGLASGVLGSMCSLGCAFARALVTLLLRKKLEEELTKSVTPVVLDAILPGPILKQLATTIREQATMNGKTNLTAFTSVSILSRFAITNAIQAGYSYSLRSIFLAIIPFSAILLIAACFVPNLDQFNTLKVARRLQGPDGNAPQNDEEAAEEPGLELSMLGRPVSAADVI